MIDLFKICLLKVLKIQLGSMDPAVFAPKRILIQSVKLVMISGDPAIL